MAAGTARSRYLMGGVFMADINKAMDTLSEMLSSPEGKQNIADIMDSFTSGGSDFNDRHESSFPGGMNMDYMLKIKSAMDELQNTNDRRSNLLLALKPYLRSSRYGKIDETINLLKLARLPDVIKSMRK